MLAVIAAVIFVIAYILRLTSRRPSRHECRSGEVCGDGAGRVPVGPGLAVRARRG